MSNILIKSKYLYFWVRHQELVPAIQPTSISAWSVPLGTLSIIRVTGTFRSLATNHIARRLPSVQEWFKVSVVVLTRSGQLSVRMDRFAPGRVKQTTLMKMKIAA
jgi:hypothetical protein